MNCPRCNSTQVIKYGSKQGIQRYHCMSCDYYFTQNTRLRLSEEQKNMVFKDLLSGVDRQEVANRYGVSLRTIQRWVSKYINSAN